VTGPARCSFEVTVGENAMDFTPEEVAAFIRDVLTRAAEPRAAARAHGA
jgi:hypothetical protein